MKHARSTVFQPLRLLSLAAALLAGNVYADDYTDVTQLVRNGKLAEAMAKADQYLSAKPKDPQMRFLKGVIQRDSGKTPEAIGTITRLTEDYPELPEPYNNLAVLYAGQSQFDKARTALEMAIRTNPSYATAHENLGDVYAKLASQAYNKALQLDNTNTAVAPKLALIRELFSATGAKGQRPAPTPAVAPTPAPAPTPVAATKPAPTLPTQVAVAKPAPPATTPAAATPAATPVPAPAPVVVAPATVTPAPTVATPSNHQTKDAEAAVKAWAIAWAAKDVKGYLASYGKDFNPPGSMSRSQWEAERKQRIGSKSNISIKLENLSVTVDGSKAVAKFRQDYKASGLAVSSRKTLDLVKSGDRWQIVKESTGS
jgi:tetratricopeptide (TPR) repeat protein